MAQTMSEGSEQLAFSVFSRRKKKENRVCHALHESRLVQKRPVEVPMHAPLVPLPSRACSEQQNKEWRIVLSEHVFFRLTAMSRPVSRAPQLLDGWTRHWAQLALFYLGGMPLTQRAVQEQSFSWQYQPEGHLGQTGNLVQTAQASDSVGVKIR